MCTAGRDDIDARAREGDRGPVGDAARVEIGIEPDVVRRADRCSVEVGRNRARRVTAARLLAHQNTSGRTRTQIVIANGSRVRARG